LFRRHAWRHTLGGWRAAGGEGTRSSRRAPSRLSPDTWAAMQRKNLLIFLVASALFVGGLYLLDKHLFPPGPQPVKKKEVEKLSREPGGLAIGGRERWGDRRLPPPPPPPPPPQPAARPLASTPTTP